jgi:hypothetical protein
MKQIFILKIFILALAAQITVQAAEAIPSPSPTAAQPIYSTPSPYSEIDPHATILISLEGEKDLLEKLETVFMGYGFKVIAVDKNNHILQDSQIKITNPEEQIKKAKYRLTVTVKHKSYGLFCGMSLSNNHTKKSIFDSAGSSHNEDDIVKSFKGTIDGLLHPENDWP